MHSRSAACVLGEARLISSPTTTLAKIAPGRNAKSRRSWLKTLTPVMSLGNRSGVNCTRRTEQSMDFAKALASMVLPTPGTSSISRCPSASRTVIAVSITSDLPSITVAMARRILLVTSVQFESGPIDSGIWHDLILHESFVWGADHVHSSSRSFLDLAPLHSIRHRWSVRTASAGFTLHLPVAALTWANRLLNSRLSLILR